MQETSSQTSGKIARPPVVAILGHVDHGKTSLLDKIRNTNITAREAGGITQSIGAWQITISKGQKITFIDTPGHAAFEGMRARGAKIADLAVLVIAADDGVMPQTKESLEFLRASNTPFLVAITKVDLQTAQIDKVKNQLLELEVVPEDYGGQIIVLEVSSKTGKGVEELLEMLSLVGQMHNISGDPKGPLSAYILEAERDPRRGVVVSVVVKNGTLKVGETVIADQVSGKVRGLFDENKKPVKEIGLSTPAEVIGFATLPKVGSEVKVPQEKTEETKEGIKSLNITKGFPIILKADTAGSLEAIMGQLGEDVGVVLSAVGDIVESDVLTASSTGATLIGFNIKLSKEVLKLAEEEKVKIYSYKIIYELLSDIQRWIKEVQEQGVEKILGVAQVVAQFPHDSRTKIAGCKVLEGRIIKTDRVRLKRGEEILGLIKLQSIKKQKQEVDRAEKGEECGIIFEPQFDFQIGDVLESIQ